MDPIDIRNYPGWEELDDAVDEVLEEQFPIISDHDAADVANMITHARNTGDERDLRQLTRVLLDEKNKMIDLIERLKGSGEVRIPNVDYTFSDRTQKYFLQFVLYNSFSEIVKYLNAINKYIQSQRKYITTR